MGFIPSSSQLTPDYRNATVEVANSLANQKGIYELARKRFQNPSIRKRGAWWVIDVRIDTFEGGNYKRKKTTVRLAPATMNQREAQKVANEYLRPMNQGLETLGSATNFARYVQHTYQGVVLPLMASSTQQRTAGIIKNYLLPAFGDKCLRDLTPMALQTYFTAMIASPLSHESKDKIRDTLSGILASAVKFGLLITNPMENVRIPPEKRGKKRNKPYITPQQFEELVSLIAEPYSTMIYVAAWTGFRVSEICALRWRNVDEMSRKISIEERYSRGDWSAPKTEASNATVEVNGSVITRLVKLKGLVVRIRAGNAVRTYRLPDSPQPDDLIFASVCAGKPMRDNNILSRHIKPAARKLGLPFVNWLVLRRSFATFLKIAGADVKDAQALMRHARASTTLDIYQQFVPESQRRTVDSLSSLMPKMVQ